MRTGFLGAPKPYRAARAEGYSGVCTTCGLKDNLHFLLNLFSQTHLKRAVYDPALLFLPVTIPIGDKASEHLHHSVF